MHHKFHTDALIVGSAVFGEANKVYELFTRDFGMIRASAQGVRLAKSKLKYALQDLSYVRVDLVQGKGILADYECDLNTAISKI